MHPTSHVSTHITPQTQSEITATNETQVSEIALNALRVLSVVLLAAGVGCLIASLVVPAIGCVVAGAALFIILKCAVDETYDPNAYAPSGPNPPNTTNHEPNPANSSVLIPIADVTNIPEPSQSVIETPSPPVSLSLPDQNLLPLDPSALGSSTLYFPAQDAIVSYLTKHPLTSYPYLTETKIIETVAKVFSNQDKTGLGVDMGVILSLHDLNANEKLELSQMAFMTIQLKLTQALKDCANGKPIENATYDLDAY